MGPAASSWPACPGSVGRRVAKAPVQPLSRQGASAARFWAVPVVGSSRSAGSNRVRIGRNQRMSGPGGEWFGGPARQQSPAVEAQERGVLGHGSELGVGVVQQVIQADAADLPGLLGGAAAL